MWQMIWEVTSHHISLVQPKQCQLVNFLPSCVFCYHHWSHWYSLVCELSIYKQTCGKMSLIGQLYICEVICIHKTVHYMDLYNVHSKIFTTSNQIKSNQIKICHYIILYIWITNNISYKAILPTQFYNSNCWNK